VIAGLRAREAELRTTPHAVHPRVLVLEWTDPPMSGGHWTPGLVELAGGAPLLAHPGANSQTLTWRQSRRPIRRGHRRPVRLRSRPRNDGRR